MERKAKNRKMTLDLNLYLPHEHQSPICTKHYATTQTLLYFESQHATDLTFLFFCFLLLLLFIHEKCSFSLLRTNKLPALTCQI